MTELEQLNAYLRNLERRFRLFAFSRGTAIVAASALFLTVLFVWVANRYAFAQQVVLPLRILLFFAVAAGLSLLIALPIYKLTRARVAKLIEQRAPDFEQRLLTLSERRDTADPWTEVLAEDALRIARAHTPEEFSSRRTLFSLLGTGIAAAAVLLWLVLAGPGYWGYGADLLWTGTVNAAKRPLYDIDVKPGNKTIRRKADQAITANLLGFSAQRVTLHAKYGDAPKWDQTLMSPVANGNGYRFLFAGLSDTVEYYVEADKLHSRHFVINVKDFPAVKRVRVALRYPQGLGLQNVVLDPAGDVRAVNGTEADISVLTDRPLDAGVLVLDNGKKIELKHTNGNWYSAPLKIEKDGSYHVAALDGNEAVRISDDYFIEAKKDEAPSVKILKPGHDPHVSPIEELPVTVSASDDFGVQGLDLHYSVNGGEEKVVPLLKAKGSKEADGGTTVYFENLKVVPGDLVSFYATARDAKAVAQSEIIFAQAEPFDFKFSQSQQSGGGGGGGMGNQSSDISQRQKQIIAATFNEVKDKGKSAAALREDAKFLSDLQSKLGEQAKTLAERMGSREMGASGPEFEQFSKLMTQASSDMGAAVEQLKPGKWHDALNPEQKALGSLLRAEALFRDIQVAFGQMGGGGGGSNGAQRDLARMFDLELDTTKNQYETGQSANPEGSKDTQKALDEAFERLQALARRQEELAAQNNQQQASEQRWQEEQLRREAEQLRKQLQQLAKNSQGQQSESQEGQSNPSQQGGKESNSSSSSGGSSGNSSRSGRQNQQQSASNAGSQQQGADPANRESMKRATDALQRAEDEMRNAVSNRDATSQTRALNQLREAQDLMNQMMVDQAGKGISNLANRAERLAEAQKSAAGRMKQMYGADESANARSRNLMPGSSGQGGESMPEMNDPNSMRFGYGFRRRFGGQEMRPQREPTAGEQEIAEAKERLSKEVEQLQRQIQEQAQSIAGSHPDASAKLSRALSEAEQKELALRMQKDAEWLRQGYGERNLGMEDGLTTGLQQLSRDLRGASEGLKSGAGAQGREGKDQTARALSEVRSLREELQRRSAENSRASNSGQANNGQQQGSPGQQGQQGDASQGSPSNQGGGQVAENGAYSPRGGGATTIDRGGVQSAIAQLNGLRAQLDPRDRALGGYIDGVLGNLHHLTGAQAGLLDQRISQDALTSLQRLEAELGKRVGQAPNNGTRTGAPEDSPEKYREAVAGYFRKLSQSK